MTLVSWLMVLSVNVKNLIYLAIWSCDGRRQNSSSFIASRLTLNPHKILDELTLES